MPEQKLSLKGLEKRIKSLEAQPKEAAPTESSSANYVHTDTATWHPISYTTSYSSSVPKEIAGKLALVVAEIGFVEATGKNDHFGYSYQTHEDILIAARKAFRSHGLVLLPECVEDEVIRGSKGILTRVTMRYTLVDSETGVSWSATWKGDGMDSSDKGLYKAYTGALKYFLKELLMIPSQEDEDFPTQADPETEDLELGLEVTEPTVEQKSMLNRLSAAHTYFAVNKLYGKDGTR